MLHYPLKLFRKNPYPLDETIHFKSKSSKRKNLAQDPFQAVQITLQSSIALWRKQKKIYANIILENSEDPNNLWKSINNILHRFPVSSLSENPSLKTICEKFLNFFVDKITIICLKFPDDNDLQNVYPSLDIIFLMNTLTLATETEIKKLFMKSKSTSSDLDPFPTSLLEGLSRRPN